MRQKILIALAVINGIFIITLIIAVINKDSLTPVPQNVTLPNKTNPQVKEEIPQKEPSNNNVNSSMLAKDGQKRNIMFSYRDSRPKTVYLVGDFNDWKIGADKFTKGKNHTWTIIKQLSTKMYRYQYWVDGKLIKDPNNPKIDSEGKSLLIVKPKEEKK